jgi:hypothetical protein
LIAYAQPIVAELRANLGRMDADFSATPFKAKIANADAPPQTPEAVLTEIASQPLPGRDGETSTQMISAGRGTRGSALGQASCSSPESLR